MEMRYQIVEDSYVAFHGADADDFDDLQEEELNINWCVLCARVTAVFILVCMIASVALGKVDHRFFFLGAILFGACALCLVGSFFECCQKRFFVSAYRTSTHPKNVAYPRGFSETGGAHGNTTKSEVHNQNNGYYPGYADSASGKVIA